MVYSADRLAEPSMHYEDVKAVFVEHFVQFAL
jgi:hypothetical protein